jgi:hypothetical protein
MLWKRFNEKEFLDLQNKIHDNLMEHFEPILMALRPGVTEDQKTEMLRDAFANSALAGLVTSNVRDCQNGTQHPDRYAEDAYCIADSMLEARKKPVSTKDSVTEDSKR